MTKLKHMVLASKAFLGALFRPAQPEQRLSENGHSVLKQWENSPEESLIERAKAAIRNDASAPILGLYGCAGPHAGEVLFIRRNFETLGCAANNSVVVTPAHGDDSRQFRLLTNGEHTLMAETGNVFRLNGQKTNHAPLYDYDELELLGNRFLVFELPTLEK